MAIEKELSHREEVDCLKSENKSCKEEIDSQKTAVQNMEQEMIQKDVVIERITNELRETKTHADLAEKQYDGLKANVERLQNENDELKKSNDEMVNRVVIEKEKFVEEMNKMTELYEQAKKKIEMLTKLQEQEKKRFTWRNKNPTKDDSAADSSSVKESSGRRFGGSSIVIPSSIKQKIQAHGCQATCVRYDSGGGDFVGTASEDATVKIWSTGNGAQVRTYRGSTGHVILGLDISGELTAGGGTDKTCRVWNNRTQRLLHQLVGHSSKITCVRFSKNGGGSSSNGILTSSADRSIKVWDISRHTYRQNVTFKHGSVASSIDLSYDGFSVVSGHVDGAVRFWDIRQPQDKTAEVSALHSTNGITSVHFNPTNNAEILTMGCDNTLKIVDVRKQGQALQTFYHEQFKIDANYATCAISPDGKYAAAGSTNGNIFIWNTVDGKLVKQLEGSGNGSGVIAVAWDRGGSNGQQFSSVDRKGCLVLWA